MHLSHELFIIDANLKSPLNFDNRKKITEDLINELLKTLKMLELSELEIYDATDEKFPGWSFIQPITTSHISGHYFEENKTSSHIHMDIYSCKKFDWKIIISVLNKHLHLDEWVGNFILRRDILSERDIWSISGHSENVDSMSESKMIVPK